MTKTTKKIASKYVGTAMAAPYRTPFRSLHRAPVRAVSVAIDGIKLAVNRFENFTFTLNNSGKIDKKSVYSNHANHYFGNLGTVSAEVITGHTLRGDEISSIANRAKAFEIDEDTLRAFEVAMTDLQSGSLDNLFRFCRVDPLNLKTCAEPLTTKLRVPLFSPSTTGIQVTSLSHFRSALGQLRELRTELECEYIG